MNVRRLLSGEAWKGTKHYLDTQKKYEILKTVLLYAISGALFAIGWITTKSRLNLLTVVAVLGILPATKACVIAITFCLYSSLTEEKAEKIEGHVGELTCLYDMVFTSSDKNYAIGHLTVKGNTVCGYSEQKKFEEQGFYRHVDQRLKADQLKNVNVKIFTDLQKYVERLDQMRELSCDESKTREIVDTLKSVSL